MNPLLDGKKKLKKYIDYYLDLISVIDYNEVVLHYDEYKASLNNLSYAEILDFYGHKIKDNTDIIDDEKYNQNVDEPCSLCSIDEKYLLIDRKVLFENWGFV